MRHAQRLLGVSHARKSLRGITVVSTVVAAVFTIVAAGVLVPASQAYATPSASSLQQQIKTQSTALEVIVEKYNGITEQLKADQAKEKKLKADMAPTLRKLTDLQQSIDEIATSAYMAGPVDSLTALVSTDNTSDLLDEMTAINQVAMSQGKDIARYSALKSQYDMATRQLQGLMAIEHAQKKSLIEQKATINTKLAKLYKMRAAAYGSATQQGGQTYAIPAYLPGRGGAVVKFAYAQLGKPYAWAADGPGSYDCSGLTLAAYRSVGVTLPHNAAMQWNQVHHIPRGELSPGDLVFYENLGHVAIYIGGGKVIHAPTFGEVVKISSVDMMPPYGYGRP